MSQSIGDAGHQAQRIGATMRGIVDDLSSAQPDLRLARRQLRAVIERATDLERKIMMREAAGLDAPELVHEAARTYLAQRGMGDSPTRVAAYLARTIDVCAHLSVGDHPGEPALDPGDVEALRLAVRVHGIAGAALAWFAVAYPEHAVKIDVASLDRLVTAWTAGVDGGRWPVIADVWWLRFRVKLAPDSIKKEIAKLPK
jgi:hypothetical protein